MIACEHFITKILGLLTLCNSRIAHNRIEQIMLTQAHKHWEKSFQFLFGKAGNVNFDADAEIFSDASVKGFGAYLVLRDEQKVKF